jgi:hypothetical protein
MAATPKDFSERKKYLSRAFTRHCAVRFHSPACGPRQRQIGPAFSAAIKLLGGEIINLIFGQS